MRRLRFITLGLVAIASAVALMVPSSQPAHATSSITSYTFAQAVTAGVINPADFGCTSGTSCSALSGYSFCSTSTDDGGFSSQAALESVMSSSSETDACVADPRTANIVTGTDDATDSGAGKIGAGQDSTDSNGTSVTNGWRMGVEVGSPVSDNNVGDEIFARLHCINASNQRDDEIGWYWTHGPYGDTGPVTYIEQGTTTSRKPMVQFPQYVLTPGKYYGFRCHGYGANGTVLERLKLDGTWQGLTWDANGGCVQTNCLGEVGTEIKCENISDCPSQNANVDGSGINYHKIQYKVSGSWYGWTGPPVYTTTVHDPPLSYCNPGKDQSPADFTAFRTPKGSC